MKTLVQVHLLALSLLLLGGLTGNARADTVKLKDGKVLEGKILSEDDKEVVIEVKFAGGTILKKQTVARGDIAELTKPSPEEIAKAQMLAAYQPLKLIQLDPNTSVPLAQYDKVVNEQLQPFLTKYPNSPNAQEIADKIKEWKAERARVADDEAKYKGEWLPVEEATKRTERDTIEKSIEQAGALAKLGRYGQADQVFAAIPQMSQHTKLVIEARKQQTATLETWVQQLKQREDDLAGKIKTAEDAVAAAQPLITSPDPSVAVKAQAELARANHDLLDLRHDLELVQKLIPQVTAHAAGVKTMRIAAEAKLEQEQSEARAALPLAIKAPPTTNVLADVPRIVPTWEQPKKETSAPETAAVSTDAESSDSKRWSLNTWVFITIASFVVFVALGVLAYYDMKKHRHDKESVLAEIENTQTGPSKPLK